MDFYAESKNAGVRYEGTNLVLHSLDYWAACAECAAYVDAEDVEGLLNHAVAALDTSRRLDGVKRAVFIRHTRYAYELFFRNRIRVKE
jgi:hypothetical protein